MSARYTPLPSQRDIQDDMRGEMEAAFDYSEDEDDDHDDTTELHPLNPTTPVTPSAARPSPPTRTPGTYDFENVEYDYPPPGSPPQPSAAALTNDYGNSNGFVPSFPPGAVSRPQQGWFRRTATSVLPTALAQRFGFTPQRPIGAIGGGTANDGVFSNVTAKPSRPVTIQDGDETYVVPEDTRPEAPPSYASAQADAVPPYWETTVHAPFSPGSMGEMIVDSLPTGSLFSFLWNMLVSISFQFVGFLLTYLLHTTHAARLGSRAGLGVTLIQYGFALREKLEGDGSGGGEWNGSWGSEYPKPTPLTGSHYNSTSPQPSMPTTMSEEQANVLVADATTEWLSFFLMTVGWFILLTSLLGFWRVKRWERGILASRENAMSSTATTQQPSSGFPTTLRFERFFGLHGGSRRDLFRRGFGLGRRRSTDDEGEALTRAEEGHGVEAVESDYMLPLVPNDPNRSRIIADALANDRRLQADLRSAGLL